MSNYFTHGKEPQLQVVENLGFEGSGDPIKPFYYVIVSMLFSIIRIQPIIM